MKDAERLARLEERMRRCLALLEAERPEDARRELAQALAARPEAALAARSEAATLAAELSDQELESAFDRAQPVEDEVVDADRVAREAIHAVDRELLGERAEPRAAFATGTMAELLERQGDLEGARRIRESLAHREVRSEPAPRIRPRPDRARVLATLEQWLVNVRRKA